MKSLAAFCVRHRIAVIVVWLVALVGITVISQTVGSAYRDSFQLPNTESTQAFSLLQAADPKISGDVEHIVIAVPAGHSITDPATEAAVTRMLDKVAALPGVGQVVSPYSAEGAHQVSKSDRVAYATVTFSKPSYQITSNQAKRYVALTQTAASPVVTIADSGLVAGQAEPQKFGGSMLGILLAAVVLLFVFGSIFAMALPLLSAVLSLGTALAVIGLLSHAMTMPTVSDQLVLLIGLGVGVDYALFIVTRHRQGLVAGRDTTSSIVTAVDTSGRAVLFAGIIVCIALLGMFALQVGFLFGMAVAASIGVAFTMLAAITFIPALLSLIGPRVLSRRQRRKLRDEGPRIVGSGTTGFWPRWADFMRRRPVVPAVSAFLIVAILAVPFFSMRLGNADQGSDPTGSTTRVAYDLLAEGFGPGFNGPLELVATTTDATQEAAFREAVDKVSTVPGVASVTPAVAIPTKGGKTLMVAQVNPTSSPQSAQTTDLIGQLRKTTIPAAAKGTGVTILVGGITAVFVDFADVLSSKLPLFIGIVVLFSFLLLAVVFRSLVIPLTAAVMNLLSIAASFGVMVAIFQHGFMASAIGVSRTGPIESFIPVVMFAIIFGLSMDYEVFLVTRIHEEWLRTGDNTTAVRNGLAMTGKTITAAALIMLLVFGSFILGGSLVIKEFGVGLAAGVLVDAVLIRMAIVPSVMRLIGKANWWFPPWLDRITPRISVDPSDEEELLTAQEPSSVS